MKSIAKYDITFQDGESISLSMGPDGQTSRGTASSFRRTLFDPGLNNGPVPWDRHPEPKTAFTPKYVALVYITITADITVDVLRVHFPATPNGGSNEWFDNLPGILGWINYLNNRPYDKAPEADGPTAFTHYDGWKDFSFSQQHHVIFYFRNKTITLNEDYPIWIGTKVDGNLGISVASPNHSFFEADVYDVGKSIGTGPSKFIHVKNYFETVDGTTYRAIKKDEKFVYSLNVNSLLDSSLPGERPYGVPIDPDTGNMGEGGHP